MLSYNNPPFLGETTLDNNEKLNASSLQEKHQIVIENSITK